MTLVDVGDALDFAEGRMRVVEVGGKELGVLRWRDAWYAVRNVCPHLGAPLCLGRVQPRLRPGAARGEIAVDRGRPVLMCPWHRWEFDLESGCALDGPDAVRSYDVCVEGGRVLVDDAPSARQARAADGTSASVSPPSHSA